MDKESVKEKIKQGMRTAFENKSIQSDIEYRPQFVFNDFRKGRKVLASLERELLHCDYCPLLIGDLIPMKNASKDINEEFRTERLCDFTIPKIKRIDSY